MTLAREMIEACEEHASAALSHNDLQLARAIGKSCALAALRTLAERGLSEGMLQAGWQAPPLPTMRASKMHYDIAFRAMLAALIGEIEEER